MSYLYLLLTVFALNCTVPRVAIAAIFRNEHPYVLEWIAHHRALGVAQFYIADNVSDDGTSELLQALDALGAGAAEPRLLVTGTIGLDETPEMFEALKHRTHQCKVLIAP